MKASRFLVAAGAAAFVVAGALLALCVATRWDPVHDSEAGAYYVDRDSPSPKGVVQLRTLLHDYRGRNARNERSALLSVRFDCLYDDVSVIDARTFEGPGGRGARVRDQDVDELQALSGSRGIVDAMRAVCDEVLADLDSQPIVPVALHGLRVDRFLRCGLGTEQDGILDRFIARVRPAKKFDGVWVYSTMGRLDGESMPNFPVKSLEIGVCNARGDRDCAQAAYAALVLDGPAELVRAILERNFRVDFAEAVRSPTGAALRPLLVAGEHAWESKLVCSAVGGR